MCVYAELHEYTRSARSDIRGGIYIYIYIYTYIYLQLEHSFRRQDFRELLDMPTAQTIMIERLCRARGPQRAQLCCMSSSMQMLQTNAGCSLVGWLQRCWKRKEKGEDGAACVEGNTSRRSL